jgi:hypothetical protein
MPKDITPEELGATLVQATTPAQLGATEAGVQTVPIPESVKILEALKGVGEYGLGAAEGVAEPVVGLSDLINKYLGKIPFPGKGKTLGQELPQLLEQYQLPEFGEGVAYEAGKPLGEALAFAAGGEALAPMRGAEVVGELAPSIEKTLMDYFKTPAGKSLIRTGFTGGYGAAESPEDPARGALLGAGLGGAAEAIPAGIGMAAKGAFSPTGIKTQAGNILNEISGGLHESQPTTALETSGKMLAQDVKSSFDTQVAKYTNLINPVMDEMKDENIYQFGKPVINYENIVSGVDDEMKGITKKLHQSFLDNPLFNSAHSLQSEIGATTAGVKFPTSGEGSILKQLGMARGGLKDDMLNFLKQKDPTGELAERYTAASDLYRDKAGPYLESNRIKEIAKGKVKNPRNVATMFKNPSLNVEKVINDIGDEAKNRVLYEKLGMGQKNLDPEKLLRNYDKLGNSKLGSYITDDLETQMEKLRSKVSSKRLLEGLTGGILGSKLIRGLLSTHPVGALPSLAGGLWGAARAPSIARSIGAEISPIMKGISKLLGTTYPALKAGTISQALRNK